MTTNTITTYPATTQPALLPRIGNSLLRALEYIGSLSQGARCAREAERLMQLSDAQLAARGLTRDGIIRHVFARYMI